jgi:hypothetical protein
MTVRLDRYDNHGTFTLSQQWGATFSLTFHGTAIWLFGAKRGNHGTYATTLDNLPQTNGNGNSTQELFRQVLFNSECPNGQHSVVLTNTGSITNFNYVDIDFVRFLISFQ